MSVEEEKIEQEVITEQLPDGPSSLNKDMMTMREYADSIGKTYENVRKQVAKLRDKKEFVGHIITLDVEKDGKVRSLIYIDKVVQDYLAARRRSDPVVIDDNNEKLELELREVKEDRDRQREEKDLYIKKLQEVQAQLLEYKDNPEKAIDTSKYILLEDHEKLERELKEKEEEIEELSEKKRELEEENKALKKDQEQLRDVTLKNVELSKKNDERLQEIRDKEDKIIEAERAKDKANAEKMLIEAEKTKLESEIEAEKTRAAIEKERAAHELEEALKLGFFARRKKLKELKNKQNESKEEE